MSRNRRLEIAMCHLQLDELRAAIVARPTGRETPAVIANAVVDGGYYVIVGRQRLAALLGIAASCRCKQQRDAEHEPQWQ
jgi:hypothetical protein